MFFFFFFDNQIIPEKPFKWMVLTETDEHEQTEIRWSVEKTAIKVPPPSGRRPPPVKLWHHHSFIPALQPKINSADASEPITSPAARSEPLQKLLRRLLNLQHVCSTICGLWQRVCTSANCIMWPAGVRERRTLLLHLTSYLLVILSRGNMVGEER